MNDNELIDYIRKVPTNFNSYIEKGTIEMNLEYYNLCEELMARGINSMQENKRLKGSLQTYEILLKANVEENQQLKEQLKQKEDIINKIRELIDELYLTNDDKCYDIYKNILNILDNKGE